MQNPSKNIGSGSVLRLSSSLIPGSDVRHASSDMSPFSTSLPVFPCEKVNLNSTGDTCKSVDDGSCSLNKFGPYFLPDDEEELFSGIMDEFQIGLPNEIDDDVEEYDVFSSGGGMEIESGMSNISLSENGVANGHHVLPHGLGTVSGEHPSDEHPSRTLFVRNINSSVEDSELRALFEQYGDIRTIYTACKHRGFVMISYYDIRDARIAMKALQNKPLRRRKLDIHFSIPKDNPSDKDINQGTLVVFNLDPSVSNDYLRGLFSAYGEVKEIRETPHKRNHKFVEFYDVRDAEAALRSLNMRGIAGKHVKLEPGRPGGVRRNHVVHQNQDLDPELHESMNLRHQFSLPIANSLPGSWPHYGSPIKHNALQSLRNSPCFGSMSAITNGRVSYLEHNFTDLNPNCSSAFQHPRLFPDPKPSPISRSVSSFDGSTSNGSGFDSLSSSQFLWQAPSRGQIQGLPYASRYGLELGASHHLPHHCGSAPSGVPIERHFSFSKETSKRSFVGIGHVPENRSLAFRTISHAYYPGPGPTWNTRVENSGIEMDSKKQFQLDLEKIINGEDTRTTLMIKNIPNKYTSKMLMTAIDENFRGAYDFLYLPIDFKNKCNVGYAFINMVSPSYVIPFFKVFNGKKWEKFNSEKVALLAYARIQGKAALDAHFQNSSLMNEDKRFRPIVFDSEVGYQGYLLSNAMNIQVHQSNVEDYKGSSSSGTSSFEKPNYSYC